MAPDSEGSVSWTVTAPLCPPGQVVWGRWMFTFWAVDNGEGLTFETGHGMTIT
jgi:hypothetical protein